VAVLLICDTTIGSRHRTTDPKAPSTATAWRLRPVLGSTRFHFHPKELHA
jgi:hypothetical protein